MKPQRLLIFALALVAAWPLTRVFYVWPDLLPGPLKDVGNALIDALSIESAEASSDLEFLFLLGMLWVALILVAEVAWILWTRWRARG